MNLSAKTNNTIRLNRRGWSDDGFQSGGKSRESHAIGIFNAKRVSVLPLQNRSFNLRLLILSFFSICLLTVISCSNLAGGSSDNAGGGTPADSQIILCTGNISTSGAVSENVAGILSSAVAPTSAISSAGAPGNESQPAVAYRVCFATSRFVIQQSRPIPEFLFLINQLNGNYSL